ncbi:hypothetical protein AU476_04380 [Cupriavidus sp. UYMSc13B]|nr:hypothetical protein AU476_04380 [Cupriavidus sp. UYMSc13B]
MLGRQRLAVERHRAIHRIDAPLGMIGRDLHARARIQLDRHIQGAAEDLDRRDLAKGIARNHHHAHARPLDLRQCGGGMVEERRLGTLMLLRQCHPGLDAVQTGAGGAHMLGRALRVHDAAPGCHPVDVARADRLVAAQAVAVDDLALEQVGDRGQPDMWMRAHVSAGAGGSCTGPIWSKKINGPTVWVAAAGNNRRTVKSPRSRTCGLSKCSIADITPPVE